MLVPLDVDHEEHELLMPLLTAVRRKSQGSVLGGV